MVVKVSTNTINNNVLVVYSLMKKLEAKNSKNFFEFYTPYDYKGGFVASLGRTYAVSMELLGKFADEYGDFYVGFYTNRENSLINIFDFELFLKKESDMKEETIHDILLFKYATFITEKDYELKNFYNSIEVLCAEDKRYFELELEKVSTNIVRGMIRKGISETKQQTLDDIEAMVDGNPAIMSMVKKLM